MSRGFLLRLVIVLVLLAGGAFAGFYYTRPEVPVTAVRRGLAASAVSGTVTVRAERTYFVYTETAGRILVNDLKVGQTVKTGDLLVQIDGKALEIEIEQTNGQLAAVRRRLELGSARKFELENAEQQYKYHLDLEKSNAIPAATVDASRRAVQGIEQAIELEKTELELQLANYTALLEAKKTVLEKMTLRSPIDGLVARVEAFAGDLVSSGTMIAEILSLTRIVDARISEEAFDQVKIGQTATVRLAGYPNERFTGRVSKLASVVNSSTQRNVVEITLEADPLRLVPGMTGEAVLTVSERANALLIPRPALDGSYLYVVADGRVDRRIVKPGFIALNDAEILEGVEENELVAVDRLDLLRHGMRVRAEEDK